MTLSDGPFKKAQKLDEKWLLSLKPDRLLSRYVKNSGLIPKDSVYGGWESQGLGGHIMGHYLSACSLRYSATGDKQFLERVNYTVGELARCQQAHSTGYWEY